MQSRMHATFRNSLKKLPEEVQRQAQTAYNQFACDPTHPGLNFKPIWGKEQTYSARVGVHYRALGIRSGDVIVWVWIGSRADFPKRILCL